ncbi:hypothetical protein E8E12_003677 [Didymella heteroderae]|uniref:F-box domain-containing protein n=1 Tax=Didymella heteroderae TaxID=1769908 RepID=A0A9P4WKW6_9PLEO|nr:hypothetical protein E8E12_003677 [Didymella heteroderae]
MLKSRIEVTKWQNNAPVRKADQDKTSTIESVQTDINYDEEEESLGSGEDEDEYSDLEDDRTPGYSPGVLTPGDTEWIGMCRCLALNMDRFETDGAGRAFISGHGTPDGLGYFMVRQGGTDLNDTRAAEHPCYHSFNSGETAAFPFHDACYEVFARSLGIREAEINKDVLYDVMELHRSPSDMLRHLDLDYAHLEGAEQFWQCFSGLEYCVADPSPVSSMSQIIRDSMPRELLSTKRSTFNLAHKVCIDPLDTLPYDIVHNIFEYLDINDTLALRQASWHVFDWTRGDTTRFGKQMIRLHLSPWFWEVDDVVSSIDDPAFDFTRFFLWLEAATEPKFGMTGTFMGIANRWRIWDTCQQLRCDYQDCVVASDE